jgi:hypothetical protein
MVVILASWNDIGYASANGDHFIYDDVRLMDVLKI